MYKSKHTKLTLEKKTLPPLLPGFKLATFQSKVQSFYQQVILALYIAIIKLVMLIVVVMLQKSLHQSTGVKTVDQTKALTFVLGFKAFSTFSKLVQSTKEMSIPIGSAQLRK